MDSDYLNVLRALEGDADQTFFVLTGSTRSGTTWLQRVTDTHPDVRCIGETYLIWLGQFLAEALTKYNEKMPTQEAILNLQDGTRFPTFSQGRMSHVVRAGLANLLADNSTGPVKAVGVKDIHVFENILPVANSLPHANFIHMVRDGRDVITSNWYLNHMLDRDTARKKWPKLIDYVADAAPMWATRVKQMLEFGKANPSRCHVVRYKDLHSDILDPALPR